MEKPIIICLTPVKNEAWILERFLKCTSMWADYIIIADQNSDDTSREIAKKFDKVILVQNENNDFNEPERQKLLISEARKISGKRLLIALDADEFLTANFLDSQEWITILESKPGTVIRFQWLNITSDMTSYWSNNADMPFGFMDDGSEHAGLPIHSPRVPIPETSNSLLLRDIKVMHYQFTDWERMNSKHRWYQCWERVNNPKRSIIDIYRQYFHMYAIAYTDTSALQVSWLKGYTDARIDMYSINREHTYRWDKEVLNYINTYGAKYFRKLDIWNIDWEQKSKLFGFEDQSHIADPRGKAIKTIHRWLKWSQPFNKKFGIMVIDKFLKILGI